MEDNEFWERSWKSLDQEKGMVFHPYSPEEIDRLLNRKKPTLLEAETSGFLVVLEKGEL